MNLPAHGTTSPDPSVASLLKTHPKHRSMSAEFLPGVAPSAARRNKPRSPGGTFPLPGASARPAPLFFSHRLAEQPLPPGATRCREL